MLLTAQRVRRFSGEEGINAFCSLHGPYDWFGPPPAGSGIPDVNPGERVNERVEVQPGGNHVRSYLDIIAPDETPTSEILAAGPQLIGAFLGQELPWEGTIGRCTFRFNLELDLVDQWAEEFQELLVAALQVRVPF